MLNPHPRGGATTLGKRARVGLTGAVSVITYRLRQALSRNARSTAAMALTIAFVGGLVLTLLAGTLRTLSAPDRYTSTFGGAFDLGLDQDGPSPTATELAALPAVNSIASATFVFGTLTPDGQDQPVEAITFVGSQVAFGTRMVDGREPDPTRPTEFAASRSFVGLTGSQLGDTFTLSTITQEEAFSSGFDTPDSAGPTETATLVGVFDGAADLQDGYPVAVFPSSLTELGDIGLSGGHTVVGLSPGATVDDLRAQLDAIPDGTEVRISSAEWVPDNVRSAVRTQGQGIGVLAIFAFAAAIAVVGQLLGREHRMSDAEQLALRAIGMTERQLLLDPLSRAAIPIVVGGVASAPVAVACSAWFPRGFVTQVEPVPGVRFDPIVHLLGPIVLMLLLLGWVAVGLVLSDRRRSPSDTPATVDGLARRLGPVQLATGARFAFGAARNRRWPLAGFLGLVVVSGVVVGAVTLGVNLGHLVDEPERSGNQGLMIGSGGNEIADAVRNVLETDPDVAAVMYYGNVTVSVGSVGLYLTGLQPAKGDLLPTLLAGRLPQSDDEVVLGKVSARDLDVGIGDSIEVSGPTGPQRLRVTGIGVIPGVEGGDGVGEGGVITADALTAIAPDATFGTAAIELRADAPAGTVDRLSQRIEMGIGPTDPSGVIVNIDRVRSIPFLVATVLVAFAVLSLAHQLVTAARHRRRDVAILKALGMGRRSVTEVVHLQATLFTIAIVAVGVPIGVIAGRSIYAVVVDRIGARPDVTMPFTLLVLAVGAPVVLANLVTVVPAWRARRLQPARQLHEE